MDPKYRLQFGIKIACKIFVRPFPSLNKSMKLEIHIHALYEPFNKNVYNIPNHDELPSLILIHLIQPL